MRVCTLVLENRKRSVVAVESGYIFESFATQWDARLWIEEYPHLIYDNSPAAREEAARHYNALINKGVQMQSNLPVGSMKGLKALLSAANGSISEVLPKYLTPERMAKLVLTAANRTPDLLKCTQESLIEAILRSAELGLDCSGTLGEAYLIPYYNNSKKVHECQFIAGYRGLAKLARNSGEVKRIEAEVIHENDRFIYQKGTKFVLEFSPNLFGKRGEIIGVYSLVEFKDGAQQAVVMSKDEVEKVRAISKAGKKGPWKDHWSEMAKKTAWRRLSKWVPLSSEKYNTALAYSADDEAPKGFLAPPMTRALPEPTEVPIDATAPTQALPELIEQMLAEVHVVSDADTREAAQSMLDAILTEYVDTASAAGFGQDDISTLRGAFDRNAQVLMSNHFTLQAA